MTNKKNKPKPKGGASNGRQATIRMYNVGFGDAFLISIHNGKRLSRVLFDCGSIEAAEGIKMESIVEQIVADATDPDGVARIDVVVATHRHKDHVSGFAQPQWENVEVKEVWMPWTEDPSDPEARKIRDIQSNLALQLNAGLAARGATSGAEEKLESDRYQDLIANALMLSNDKAMKTLHSGFSGSPLRFFLPERAQQGSRARTFETGALPGVKVHVMGPSRSRDIIRDMDPPKGESFLRLQRAIAGQNGAPPAPFSADFRQDSRGTGEGVSAEDADEIRRATSLSDLAVAVALDKAVNGTSLMLMFEIAGTFLLFPGDAQWGTWNEAMADPEWSDILKKVTFYKIGHHGSHNATPKDFVEQMIPSGICAMASTLTRVIWPDIPRQPLLDALIAKDAKVARTDKPANIAKPFRVDDHGIIETEIPL